MPTQILIDDEQVTLAVTASAKDAKGVKVPGAVAFDAAPEWVSDNANVINVVPSTDGLSANCVAGLPGSTSITVNGKVAGKAVSRTYAFEVRVGPPASVDLDLSAGPVSKQ